MALEKQKNLRRIEFTFADGMVLEDAHLLYHIEFLEDGKKLSKTNHREVMKVKDALALVDQAEILIPDSGLEESK